MYLSKAYRLVVTLILTPLVLTFPYATLADDVATSESLTTLFRASRKVISVNQNLINDASKGHKGLDGKSVVEMAKANYKDASGKTLSSGKPQKAMLDSVSEIMSEAQELINQQDVGFKGFLPAIFARRVAGRFSQKMQGSMSIKLTAPKKYVRNRANRPDKWEHDVIENKFKGESYENGKPFFEVTKSKGKDAFRYILPEYYGESCLGCHGSPKGELDITGGKKEGGVLGELGGAISLAIFK